MEQLLYTMTDPNDGTVKREKLVDHLEKEALEMYPHIGNKTIRVPHAYINSGKVCMFLDPNSNTVEHYYIEP